MRHFVILSALGLSMLGGAALAQGLPGAADTSVIPAPQRAPQTTVATQGSAASVGAIINTQALPTPEPASIALFGLGVAALGVVRRRKAG